MLISPFVTRPPTDWYNNEERRFIESIAEYFDEVVYRPYLKARAAEKDVTHSIRSVGSFLDTLNLAILELYDTYCDGIFELESAMRSGNRIVGPARPKQVYADSHFDEPTLLGMRWPSSVQCVPTPNLPRMPGPSTVNNQRDQRGHYRAATTEAGYNTMATIAAGSSEEFSQAFRLSAAPISRRQRSNSPRVFTGSFSELEEALRRININSSVETTVPEPLRTATSEPTHHPKWSLNVELNAEIGLRSPLKLRESALSREIGCEARMVQGENIAKYGPGESPGIEVQEATDRLTKWLSEHKRSERPMPGVNAPTSRR